MAESRERAAGIPREADMKMRILLALAVMAATGCETTKQKEARGLVRTPYGDWVKKGTPYFGDGTSWLKPGQVPAFDGTVFTRAIEAQQQAPQPVIVVGPDTGTVVATQSSAGTVVSQFRGYSPTSRPPLAPIYTGRETPLVYTMPIQQ